MKFTHLTFFFFVTFFVKGQIITTIAGNGTYGYSGDGGPATSAQLGDLYQIHIASDNAGNIYIPMAGSHNVIRKVNAAGIITTIAGTGQLGYTGDGGPAMAARIYHPSSIVVDNVGNIIFADQNGAVIRKINTAGIITTISGPINNTCTGDGGPLSAASVYVVSGMSIDNAGNLYISDQGCDRLRKVNTAGVITTIAGTGTPGFTGDGGPATAARLDNPTQVGVDNAGNIYVPDVRNGRLRKIDAAGIITTVAGNGVNGYSGDGGLAINASFHFLTSACVDNLGNIYISDNLNHVVRKIDNAGIITTFAGNGTNGYSGDGGPANLAQMTEVDNVNIDASGNIYIVDYYNYAIRKINNCLTAAISSQPSDVILCNSGNAGFTISASNANGYKWQVNNGLGWVNITDNSTYSGSATHTLQVAGANITMNNWLYRCTVSNSCGSFFSMPAVLTVNSAAIPTLSITTTLNTLCYGTSTTFTATAINGGIMPVYYWKKNGFPTGTNASTYIDNNLNNGDAISCDLVSNNACAVTNNATSNTIVVTVNPLRTPSINIMSSANSICYGTPVIFNAVATNGGTTPIYQWKKNGLPAGSGTSSYNDASLNNSDIITCNLTSSESCLISPTAVSNALSVNVTSLVTPSISISTNSQQLCDGAIATFTSTATNTGAAPIYQWTKNGLPVGNNLSSYTNVMPQNNDIIRCTLISNANCLTTASAASNPVVVTVYQNPLVKLDHTSGLCSGSNRVLDAGSFTSYRWNNGTTGRTLLVVDTGTYYVTVVDNKGCQSSDTVKIITAYPKPKNFLPRDTAVCSYGDLLLTANNSFNTYRWNNNTTSSSLTITKPGIYWLEVTNDNNCKGADSIVITLKECMKGIYIPSAFTPNNDGNNDVFKPLIFGKLITYKLLIYNRWGQLVFQTQHIAEGWNGFFKGHQQETGTFIWKCAYQPEGELHTAKQGTVLLIR